MKENDNIFYNSVREKMSTYQEDASVDEWPLLKSKILHKRRLNIFYYSAAAVVAVFAGLVLGISLIGDQSSHINVIPNNTQVIALSCPSSTVLSSYSKLPPLTAQKRAYSTQPDYKDNQDNVIAENIVKEPVTMSVNETVEVKKENTKAPDNSQASLNLYDDFPPDYYDVPDRKMKFDLSIAGNGSVAGWDGKLGKSALMEASSGMLVSYNTSLIGESNTNGVTSEVSKVVNLLSDYNYSYHIPFSFGLSLRINLKEGFFIETGVFATNMKTDVRTGSSSLVGHIDYWYMGIPVKGSWSFYSSRFFDSYLSCGATIEKCIYLNSSVVDIPQKVKDIPILFSASANVGVQFNLIPRVALFFEPGVSYFFDKNNPLPTIRNARPFNINLNGGLRFILN